MLKNILTKKEISNQLHKFVFFSTCVTASFKQILFSNQKVVKTTLSIQKVVE